MVAELSIVLDQSVACLGSTALVSRGYFCRTPKDLDLVGRYNHIRSFCLKTGRILSFYPIDEGRKIVSRLKTSDDFEVIVEAEVAYADTLAEELLSLIRRDSDTISKDGLLIPSLDVLYMLKMSHRYLKNSPFFLKTMRDIQYLRSLGAKIRPEHRVFYQKRKEATYQYQHPKLNVSKEDFFNGDGVQYVYDHDSIHEAVKHLNVPVYTLFQQPGAEVLCRRDLFEALPEEHKLMAVLEEAYVLALERSQIPFRGQMDPERSFDIALTKICTSITSGWFREFAWEHWDEIMSYCDVEYADRFFEKADRGLVKLYRSKHGTN